MKTLKLQNLLALAIVFELIATPLSAQVDSTDVSHLLGTWRGESICQVKNSPCHDEKAVYRISKSKESGKVTIDAGKLVNGKVESMGVLDFKYDRAQQMLTCEYKHGVWKFTVKRNVMEGTLTTPDKVIYRRVSLKKDK